MKECVANENVWRTSMCSESLYLYMCGETSICVGNAVVCMKNAVEVRRKNREMPNVVVDVKKCGYMHQKYEGERDDKNLHFGALQKKSTGASGVFRDFSADESWPHHTTLTPHHSP